LNIQESDLGYKMTIVNSNDVVIFSTDTPHFNTSLIKAMNAARGKYLVSHTSIFTKGNHLLMCYKGWPPQLDIALLHRLSQARDKNENFKIGNFKK